ncbi:MAG: hypothetical protein ABI082_11710 [Dokdonella sp.]
MKFEPVYRISVFVPPAHVQRVVDGICAVDDLCIANYAHVLWTTAPGTEQFRPLPGATPAQGKIGELVRAPTVRVEFCIARDPQRLQRVIELGIRPSHPWEVPAIFVDESQLPLP